LSRGLFDAGGFLHRPGFASLSDLFTLPKAAQFPRKDIFYSPTFFFSSKVDNTFFPEKTVTVKSYALPSSKTLPAASFISLFSKGFNAGVLPVAAFTFFPSAD
jgi:hypothetical protein